MDTEVRMETWTVAGKPVSIVITRSWGWVETKGGTWLSWDYDPLLRHLRWASRGLWP